MSKKIYPSDMSRERFEQIRPLLEPRVRCFCHDLFTKRACVVLRA
ncbi:hypothetical protein [Ralstonia solanacearum]|nr:hypothetical protein [Ralstonia solanacearum]